MLKRFTVSNVLTLVLSIAQITVVKGIEEWMNDMLQLFNEFRAESNLDPLCFNEKLISATTKHMDNLIEGVRFPSLIGSDGSTSKDRIEREGYDLQGNSEMLYWGGPANSTGVALYFMQMVPSNIPHIPYRLQIQNATYQHIGIAGRVDEEVWNNRWYYVDMAGSDTEECFTATCRSVGYHYELKETFCTGRANKSSAKYARHWKIKPGSKEDILNTECETNVCKKKDCCVMGGERKCSNTGNNGFIKGGFTQKMCGNAKKLMSKNKLKNRACTGKNGFKCTQANCCVDT